MDTEKQCKECNDQGVIFAEGYGYELCPECSGEAPEKQEEKKDAAA